MSKILCMKDYSDTNSYELDDSIKLAEQENSELWVFFVVPFNMNKEKTFQALEEKINNDLIVKNGFPFKWKLVQHNPDCFMRAIMDIYPVKSIIAEDIDLAHLMGNGIRDTDEFGDIFGCPVLTGKKQRNVKRLSIATAFGVFFAAICLFLFSAFVKINHFRYIEDIGPKGDTRNLIRSHPLPVVALIVLALNLPFGFWRARVKKFSRPWFFAVHLPVPIVIAMRFLSGLGWHFITFPVLIGAFISGQYIGGKFFLWCYHT